jgi:hypothetical protein
MAQMNEFDDGWWSCFVSFANELCMTEGYCDMALRNVLNGAGIKAYEIDWALEDYGEILADDVKQELLHYKYWKLEE